MRRERSPLRPPLERVRAGAIAGPALWAASKARVLQWDWVARNPEAVQREALMTHCRLAAKTAFGRAHDLSRVHSYDDFRQRVPLRAYADFEPYIARIHAGERDVLGPGVIPYLARSAGSSESATKLKTLPVSHRQIAWQRRQAFDVVARYMMLSGDLGFPGGFTLGLLQPPVVEQRGAVGITSNPRLMQLHVPRISRAVSLPRPPVRDIEDYDAKFDAIADAYLDHDVRAVAGTTCWFSVLFDRVIAAARARGRSVSTVREVWPNLRGLFGGGVNAGCYRSILDAKIGGPTFLVDTYNATEGGILAVTDRPGDDAMAVLPDRGVFFEFVPRDEHGLSNATRVPLWDVEPGVEYSVAVSTASGLFGYLIGDVVRFTSVFPHRLVFSGRVRSEISIAHEMTTARQIEDAVRAAAAEQRSTLVEFAVSSELSADAAVGRYGDQMTAYAAGDGYTIEPVHQGPMTSALSTPGWMSEHGALMREYRHHTFATALVPTRPVGRVVYSRLFGHEETRFRMPDEDLAVLRRGLKSTARAFFAAGARRIFLPTQEICALHGEDEIDLIDRVMTSPKRFNMGTAHPQGGVPISDDPDVGAVDRDFAVVGFENLAVCDASVFPTSVGVNPIESIMALAHYAAPRILARC